MRIKIIRGIKKKKIRRDKFWMKEYFGLGKKEDEFVNNEK